MDLVTELGYPLRKLPFNQWVAVIESAGDSTHNPLQPLLPFLHLEFAGRMFGVSDAAYHALGTAKTLQALDGSRIRCAEVNRTLVQTYLRRFEETGRLNRANTLALVG